MKLDMDLIRDLLIYFEETLPERTPNIYASTIELEGYSSSQIVYHVSLLADNDYIIWRDASTFDGADYLVHRLTLNGHDFLEGIRNINAWNEIKETASKIGTRIFTAAIPIILKIIAQQAGLTP